MAARLTLPEFIQRWESATLSERSAVWPGGRAVYGPEAVAHRRCRGTRKDGQPCRAWAVWDDPRQLCMAHAGRHFRGERPYRRPMGSV